MFSAYPACFIPDESGYSVVFPDLGYLATCGQSLQGALAAAVDCLAGYLYSCQRDGSPVPAPSAPQQLDPHAIARELEVSPQGAFINMVAVDVQQYAKANFEKSVKKTLTIPAWLNTAALESNINFSQVLQDALKERLHLQ